MCSGGFPSQQQGATRAADEIVSRGRAVYHTGRKRVATHGHLPNRGNFRATGNTYSRVLLANVYFGLPWGSNSMLCNSKSMQDDTVGGARPPRWSEYEDEGALDAPGADGCSTAPPVGPKVCSASHDAGPARMAADEELEEAASQHHQGIAPQPDTTAAGDTAARVPMGAELPEPTGAAVRDAGFTASHSGNMPSRMDAPAAACALAATWAQSLEDAARLACKHWVTFTLHSAGESISVVPHSGVPQRAPQAPLPAVGPVAGEPHKSGHRQEQPRAEHAPKHSTPAPPSGRRNRNRKRQESYRQESPDERQQRKRREAARAAAASAGTSRPPPPPPPSPPPPPPPPLPLPPAQT